MAYFYSMKNLVVNTHTLQSIALNGKTITVVCGAGINSATYETEQEALELFNALSDSIKSN